MANKSDTPGERKISATEASRSFSRLLDEVESGARFVVHRRGKEVCLMSPPAASGRRVLECLQILRGRSPVLLDDGFGADLLAIIAAEPVDDERPWDS